MTPHETISIFSPLWWQANTVTVAVIVGILFAGKKLSPGQRERLAVVIGVILLARWVLYHPYVMLIYHCICVACRLFSPEWFFSGETSGRMSFFTTGGYLELFIHSSHRNSQAGERDCCSPNISFLMEVSLCRPFT